MNVTVPPSYSLALQRVLQINYGTGTVVVDDLLLYVLRLNGIPFTVSRMVQAVSLDRTTAYIGIVRQNADSAVCVVCQEAMAIGSSVATLGCGHTFHEPCIDECCRYRPLCPLCQYRVSVVPQSK